MFSLGCLVSKKKEPGVQSTGGSCSISQVPLEQSIRLVSFSQNSRLQNGWLFTQIKGLSQGRQTLTLQECLVVHVATSPPLSPDWHTSPRPGLLQAEMARGMDKRGEGRKSHAVLLKEPLEMISCGFKPHFHKVACCLGVSILGSHRAAEIVSQGDWEKNITLQVCC